MPPRGVGHFVEGRYPHFLDVYEAGMADLPPVADRADVATGFGTVRVYRFDGPGRVTPLVLLPGRNASTPMWRANLPGLAARRTVYAVDLLGEAGMSVQTRPISDAGDQAQWLEDTLAGLDLRRAHLLGASIGGWAAVNHAVRFPGRVASLTLLDPVMTLGGIPVRTLAASALMALPTPKSFRRWFLSWVSGGVMADYSLPEVRLIDSATTDFALRLPAPARITDDQLRGLTMPVLVFLGGRSVMLDADAAAAHARKLIAHSHVEVYPEASHAISGECAEAIEQVAAAFWDDVDRG